MAASADMALSTRLKTVINAGLRYAGLRMDTLTASRLEAERLGRLEKSGYFDSPAFTTLPSFRDFSPEEVLGEVDRFSRRFENLRVAGDNPVGFSIENDYFSSPDAEVLYCMIRRFEPRRFVEIGSGNSTRLARLALSDGGIESRLTSIDPQPREFVDDLSDEIHRARVESLGDMGLFRDLGSRDILFIDSSHELRAGNDVTHLYLNVLPTLQPGVVVHIHDVFLPYDYPRAWARPGSVPYSEQYLVQAMLQCVELFEVLWPGHYVQRTRADFAQRFPLACARHAQSLWLRVR